MPVPPQDRAGDVELGRPFLSREQHYLRELEPDSPRIRPTLTRLAWVSHEPGAATGAVVIDMMESA